jgi:hypothetical protein
MAGIYTTRAIIKATASLGSTTYADADIDLAVPAACEAVEEFCGRWFYDRDPSNDQTRYYTAGAFASVGIDDLISITSLATDNDADGVWENTWTLNSDYVLEPFNAVADGVPYGRLRQHPQSAYYFPIGVPRGVKVVGHFGWLSVPDRVEMAAQILAERLIQRVRSSPLGIVFSGGLDSMTALRIARSDPDIYGLLNPLRKHPGIA